MCFYMAQHWCWSRKPQSIVLFFFSKVWLGRGQHSFTVLLNQAYFYLLIELDFGVSRSECFNPNTWFSSFTLDAPKRPMSWLFGSWSLNTGWPINWVHTCTNTVSLVSVYNTMKYEHSVMSQTGLIPRLLAFYLSVFLLCYRLLFYQIPVNQWITMNTFQSFRNASQTEHNLKIQNWFCNQTDQVL